MSTVIWIEVVESERPTHYDQPVLVTDGIEVACCYLGGTDAKGHHWYMDTCDPDEAHEFEGVTHWARLPYPPKECVQAQPGGEDS
jgi:hypothetical protein